MIFNKIKNKILSLFFTKILDKLEVLNFSIEKEDDNNIIISGLSSHSAMSVSKIKEHIIKDSLCIKVYVQLGVDKGSGRFRYKIYIPKNIKKICFGRTCELIYEKI